MQVKVDDDDENKTSAKSSISRQEMNPSEAADAPARPTL